MPEPVSKLPDVIQNMPLKMKKYSSMSEMNVPISWANSPRNSPHASREKLISWDDPRLHWDSSNKVAAGINTTLDHYGKNEIK